MKAPEISRIELYNTVTPRRCWPLAQTVGVIGCLVMFLIGAIAQAQNAVPDVIVPVRAHANEVQFQLQGDTGYAGKVTYYCNQVEAYTTGMLQHLGATNVRAHCLNPGAPTDPVYEPVVTVSFETLRIPRGGGVSPLRAGWRQVSFMGMDNCFLTLDLFKNLQAYFELGDVRGFNSCGFENGPYKLTMLTLMKR